MNHFTEQEIRNSFKEVHKWSYYEADGKHSEGFCTDMFSILAKYHNKGYPKFPKNYDEFAKKYEKIYLCNYTDFYKKEFYEIARGNYNAEKKEDELRKDHKELYEKILIEINDKRRERDGLLKYCKGKTLQGENCKRRIWTRTTKVKCDGDYFCDHHKNQR